MAEKLGRPVGLNPYIDYKKPTPQQQNSLDLRKEINARFGCRVLVGTQEQRSQMLEILSIWRLAGELGHTPEVYASDRIKAGQVVIEG